MSSRFSERLVTFRSPFSLPGFDKQWHAGDYSIRTEEAPVENGDEGAYQTVRTTMIPHSGKPARHARGVEVDPAEFAAAVARDERPIDRAENEGMVSHEPGPETD